MSQPSSSQEPPINLLRGWPSSTLLPTLLIKNAATATLNDPQIAQDALSYGPDPGYEPARVAIAKWLTDSYATPSPITADRLCITGGASQNLGSLLSVYTDPSYTRNIWIIAPAYFLSFRIFEDAGFGGKMRAVPEDGEGLDIAFLEREIGKSESEDARDEDAKTEHRNEHKNEHAKYEHLAHSNPQKGTNSTSTKNVSPRSHAKLYKHIIYCVPSFANPSSRTMSLRRRRELVRLARRWDALCVADDVYDFLQWPVEPARRDGQEDCPVEEKDRKGSEETVDPSSLPSSQHSQQEHPPRLVDIDRSLDGGAEREGVDGFGNACSNGSFSKIAGPGVRCGWLEGTKKLAFGVSQTGTTRSGGAPSQLTSTFMTHLLTTNQLQTHIQQTLKPAYATNYHALLSALKTHLLPLGFTLPQPTRKVVGGFFVWLSLPEGLAAAEFARVCREEEGVVVAEGGMFEVPGDEGVRFEGNVRLCFAWEERERLVEGVRRMKKAAEKLMGMIGERGSGEYVIVERGDVGGVEGFK